MKRKTYKVGLAVLGLTMLVALTPYHTRIATSRQNFQEYFRDLNRTGTLNPVERVVFSLVLANNDAVSAKK